MSVEKVREYLKGYGLDGRIMEFEVSSATVSLAAEAIGTDPDRIAKTISLLVNDGPVLVVMSGESRVDNRKFKEEFHAKAKMIPYDLVEEYTGYAPGGVCPFALKEGTKLYMDVSVRKYDTVYPAAGNDASAVRLTVDELESCCGSLGWVDISKMPEAQ